MSERDKDELDGSDWLSSQFDTDATPVQSEPPAAPVPPVPPTPPVPPAPPAAPVPPVVPEPPVAPPAPPVLPPVAPLVAPSPSAPSAGAPFQWGLTPGDAVPAPPTPAAPEPPAPPVPPVIPSAPPAAPVPPVAPPVLPDPPVIPQPTLPSYSPPVAPPEPSIPPPPPPTQAFPTEPPTQAFPVDAPTQAFPGQEMEQRPWDPWQAQPVDSSLEGVTEVIEAEIVGLEPPAGESNPTPTPSSIDDLFGDSQFREYDGDQVFSGPPPTPPQPPGEKPPKRERAPISTTQKILIGVALGLVAVLALVALFLVGQRLASTAPAPAVTASPSPTPTATAGPLPVGPVAPGEYQWDELLGGECLDPYESAWQDRYTVVDCATPHTAQMVYRGTFPDDATVAYPGVEELTKRINLLCTAPTVINYQIAGTAADIQVTASFAATAAEWDDGDRTFYCFVSRASGESLTASVAQPQAPAQ